MRLFGSVLLLSGIGGLGFVLGIAFKIWADDKAKAVEGKRREAMRTPRMDAVGSVRWDEDEGDYDDGAVMTGIVHEGQEFPSSKEWLQRINEAPDPVEPVPIHEGTIDDD